MPALFNVASSAKSSTSGPASRFLCSSPSAVTNRCVMSAIGLRYPTHVNSHTGYQEFMTDKLARKITGPLLFLFILGDVLGAGIYALMGVLSEDVGGVLWAPLVAALLLALLTAGSYAELVTKYPRAGGAAVFAERAFGKPLLSFLVGFCMLAAGVVSAAGLALAFAGDYLQTFLDVPAVPAAVVFLVLVALVNARGIKESVRAN